MAEQGPYKTEVVGPNPTARTRAVSSMVERLVDVEDVVGPNPAPPTNMLVFWQRFCYRINHGKQNRKFFKGEFKDNPARYESR